VVGQTETLLAKFSAAHGAEAAITADSEIIAINLSGDREEDFENLLLVRSDGTLIRRAKVGVDQGPIVSQGYLFERKKENIVRTRRSDNTTEVVATNADGLPAVDGATLVFAALSDCHMPIVAAVGMCGDPRQIDLEKICPIEHYPCSSPGGIAWYDVAGDWIFWARNYEPSPGCNDLKKTIFHALDVRRRINVAVDLDFVGMQDANTWTGPIAADSSIILAGVGYGQGVCRISLPSGKAEIEDISEGALTVEAIALTRRYEIWAVWNRLSNGVHNDIWYREKQSGTMRPLVADIGPNVNDSSRLLYADEDGIIWLRKDGDSFEVYSMPFEKIGDCSM
jgi:hypothetical protein